MAQNTERLIGKWTIIRTGAGAALTAAAYYLAKDGANEFRDYYQKVDNDLAHVNTQVDQKFPLPKTDISDEEKQINDIKAAVNAAIDSANPELAISTINENATTLTEVVPQLNDYNSQLAKRKDERQKLLEQAGTVEAPSATSGFKISGAVILGGIGVITTALWPISTFLSASDKRRQNAAET